MSRETQDGTIAIDPEFQALIPSLSDDEVSELRANIEHDGCRDPLVTWEGVLLDGHHRYALCEDLGKPFKTVERPCANRDEARAWIIRNQLGRRNLTPYQRCELALKLEPLIAAQAKKKQRDSGGAVPQKSAEPPLDTRAELAREAGVSHDTIAKAKAIHEKAPEAVKAQLRTGDLSIHRAYESLRGGGAHVSHNTGDTEWFSPKEIVESARAVMGGIDLDPASTAAANTVIRAARYLTAEQDGLAQMWTGRVWMNPPYKQPLIEQFCTKLAGHVHDGDVSAAVVLVNNATETAWFQVLACAASAMCCPKGRVKFWHSDTDKGSTPLQGQAVVYLGSDVARFEEVFQVFGSVWVHGSKCHF